ncbi:leucine-rich repeat-containing protein let-4-like [Saccostrea echinata]|uniref:leucine-rich repeat-containing protein let-4-like n=1 Tax=Saccostrea echinata TaxID=191078 RepID=UPI002A837BDF|nr:leucine-rich repeat-containing protein let-4-like [Saccostrea echinata]
MEVNVDILQMCCFLLLSVLESSLAAVTYCGNGMCLCDDKTHQADCKSVHEGQKLLFFPKLPDNIEDVTIRYFKCEKIFVRNLQNFTDLPLTKLCFDSLDMQFMQTGLFRNLRNLKEVEISHNRKLPSKTLRDAFLNISSSLQILNLTSNRWNYIVPDFFKYVSHTNLSTVVLAGNQLRNLTADIFQDLKLTALDFSVLDLGNTLLRDIPVFCGVIRQSLTPNLTKLYLLNTSIITLQGYRFQCLPRLQILDLRFNYFAEIPLFCNKVKDSIHPKLQELYLSHSKIRYIFNNSFSCLPSLTKLDLSFTELHPSHPEVCEQ